ERPLQLPVLVVEVGLVDGGAGEAVLDVDVEVELAQADPGFLAVGGDGAEGAAGVAAGGGRGGPGGGGQGGGPGQGGRGRRGRGRPRSAGRLSAAAAGRPGRKLARR